MTGEKCVSCNDRFPVCQDHCEYGRAAKAERQQRKDQKEKQSQNEARDYYAAKRYRR